MRIIDLRSDTVTKPTIDMREAMASADVGDDVYGEDPTVNKTRSLGCRVLRERSWVICADWGNGQSTLLAFACQARR